MLLIPDNADKLSDAELSDDINRQNTFQRLILSSWEALVLIAILASGLPEVAEHYLSFYAPNYSSTRRFSSLFEELSEPLKLSSFGTLHQLIVNNRHEYTDDARAKKHFAFYYGGTYGDSRLKREVRQACDSEKSAHTRRSGYIGLVLGLDTESESRYLKWSSEDERAKQADIEMHLKYYGGLQQAVKHLIDQLSTPGFAPLWSCSLNSLQLLIGRTEDSLEVLRSLLRDRSTVAQIHTNLSGKSPYDNQLLNKSWQSFVTQVRYIDPTLARQLAN
jgi:hypothetical protein